MQQVKNRAAVNRMLKKKAINRIPLFLYIKKPAFVGFFYAQIVIALAD
jgi:hypothetical protein